MHRVTGFAQALIANAPSSELGDHAADFDWVIGAWSAVVRDYSDDGTVTEGSGEWWFSWVLEGRAVQDVWIVPARSKRGEGCCVSDRYGTTIRIFDRSDNIWRITWINPVTSKRNELSGRRQRNRIVLDGLDGADRIRWTFNDITRDSFTWRGEHQAADGSWTLGAEFILTRMEDPKLHE
jgi:uncharacterized protein